MFTHAFLGSNDIERSRKFYDPLMDVLGYKNVVPVEAGRLVYAGAQGTFIVAPPYNGEQATVSNGHTLGFAAPDDETVKRWHEVGLANGGADEGAPGPRAAACTTRSCGPRTGRRSGRRACECGRTRH